MKYLALLLLACVADTHAASFDCRKATTSVEKRVCANPLLGRLDDAMAHNYRGSLGARLDASSMQHLMTSQRAWLKQRDQCKDDACLEARYRARIDALCEYAPATGVNSGCVVSSDDVR